MNTNPIIDQLSKRYGVGVIVADWTTVMWAAESVAKEMSPIEAATALKKVNAIRRRHGKYTSCPAYGTELFTAFYKLSCN